MMNVHWKGMISKDIPSSFVVFLVALPLSLGIALASGAPIKAGLVAAIIGGVVVGLFSGAPLQVSGPAAGLTVMVYEFIQNYGWPETLAITLAAGLLQMLLGSLGVASLTLIISPAVIHAMLAGIGILIALGQVHVLMGQVPQGSALKNLALLPQSLQEMNGEASLIGLFTLLALIVWNRWGAKKFRWMPGALFAVLTGTLLSLIAAPKIPKVQIQSHLFDGLTIPKLQGISYPEFFMAGLALALVASAESLLCAVATDKLHRGPRSNLNRELLAQGLGNSLSGLLGGLPITGVIVRSSANIAAGASGRFSAIFHGLWIFLFATFFSDLMGRIPLAVLAALLIHIGINLVKLKEIKHLMEFKEVLVYLITLLGVVFLNLLAGIGLGLGLSIILLLYRMSKIQIDINNQGDNLEILFKGSLTFVCVPRLMTELRKISPQQIVYLKFDIHQIDHSVIEAIRAWKIGYENLGGTVYKISLNDLWKETWTLA